MIPPPAPVVEEVVLLLPPALMDDIVEEILLRLPPAEPASLVNAALVCKLWRRILSDRGFRRRFREIHRTPPMLAFLCNDVDARGYHARFVPTTRSSGLSPVDHRGWRVRDSRHGRVLLHPYPWSGASFRLLVWNPITDERLELPKPPREPSSWSAAVLCAASASAAGECDHLHCHGGSFIVVFVGTGAKDMFACVYSSDAGAWSEPTYAKHPGDRVSQTRSALVGNALYFVLPMKSRILKYDLGTQKMSVIELPSALTNPEIMPSGPIQLTTMEDGRLGFARIEDSRLCIWTRDDEDEGWTQIRAIELEKLLPLNGSSTTGHDLVGFADGAGVIFLRVEGVIFSMDLKSGRPSKVYEGSRITSVVPYMNFCTPVFGVPSTDDGSRAGASSA